jgi:DNA replication protein DnaC
MKPVAIGRNNFLFVGSPSDGKTAAAAHILIETAKMNDVIPMPG